MSKQVKYRAHNKSGEPFRYGVTVFDFHGPLLEFDNPADCVTDLESNVPNWKDIGITVVSFVIETVVSIAAPATANTENKQAGNVT